MCPKKVVGETDGKDDGLRPGGWNDDSVGEFMGTILSVYSWVC